MRRRVALRCGFTRYQHNWRRLVDGMKRRGVLNFSGRANMLRIGCMGDVTETDMSEAMQVIAVTLGEMGGHPP